VSEGGLVPDGAVINSATLSVKPQLTSGSPGGTITATRLLKNWKEMEATWFNAENSVTWSTAGALGVGTDLAAILDGQVSISPQSLSSNPRASIDVSASVRSFASGAPNYGWRLASVIGSQTINIATRESGIESGPKLIVDYALPPNPPSGLVATLVSGNQINLTWADNSTDETGFKIERKAGAGGTYNQIATVSANTTSYADTSVVPGNTYYYRVRATSSVGDSGYSNEVSVALNEPPAVSITSPANGTIFVLGAAVAITASATDTDGTVAKVDFFDGATLLGTATAAPYSVTLANVAAGTHTLTARATDNLGASTTSAAVSIIVDAPPTVTITAPANNTTFSAPANITVAATAADTDGTVARVDFFDDATLVGTATTAPYSITLANVTAGTHTLTARAIDDRGITTTSAPVTITGVEPIYYIHPDHLNTPRLIADSTGTTVWRWDQGEPFGNDVPNDNPSEGGPFEFNLRFPGQYIDRETNLAYNYFRDYDPALGRYVESDPIGLRGGLNMYAYVYNPLTRIDPLGLLDLNVFGQIGAQGSLYFLVGGFSVAAGAAVTLPNGQICRFYTICARFGPGIFAGVGGTAGGGVVVGDANNLGGFGIGIGGDLGAGASIGGQVAVGIGPGPLNPVTSVGAVRGMSGFGGGFSVGLDFCYSEPVCSEPYCR